MTMFSFRVAQDEAADVRRWQERLGIGRSELLREALHRYLISLRAESDIAAWGETPLSGDEQALSEIADWGPADDWSEWADAAG